MERQLYLSQTYPGTDSASIVHPIFPEEPEQHPDSTVGLQLVKLWVRGKKSCVLPRARGISKFCARNVFPRGWVKELREVGLYCLMVRGHSGCHGGGRDSAGVSMVAEVCSEDPSPPL